MTLSFNQQWLNKFFSLFTVVLMASFMSMAVIPEAEAKRFGGGGFGKSYKTSPFAKKKAAPEQKKADQQQAGGQQKGRGLMGGMLGGLLAGGLFAYLLGSGAFEGIQFMDILLMVGLFFIVMKLLKGFAQSQTQTRQSQPQAAGFNQSQAQQGLQAAQQFQAQTAMSSADEIPMNLPQGFDQQEFLAVAESHYRELQQAWNDGELNKIEEFVATNLYQALAAQRQQLMVPPQTEILDLTSELVRADYDKSTAQVSILFKGRCKDDLEKSEDGIFDIWHLERDLTSSQSPWLIVGIEAE